VGALDLVSLLFNLNTGRYQMTALTQNATITINMGSTTCRLPLGIDGNATGTLVFGFQGVAAAATFFPFPADFLGITKIKVCSNALAGHNYDSVSLNTSTLVDTISVSAVPFGLTIYNSLGRESYVTAKRIDEIDIQLTDQDDKDIDFNNAHWSMTIILNTHRRQIFSNDEGIINFQKIRREAEAKQKPVMLKNIALEDDILLGE
tara:strand:- start:283 stop:897 length:615 start_codon:yes stop_codon:yes gene_type:complete